MKDKIMEVLEKFHLDYNKPLGIEENKHICINDILDHMHIVNEEKDFLATLKFAIMVENSPIPFLRYTAINIATKFNINSEEAIKRSRQSSNSNG